ncbi:MAG: hypothetical protein Q8L34_00360 [Candidatus Woesearchaeota archaeon]|nr:hypothetical protein [Candidatus Woesearchaeota archaeon]
MEKVMKVWAKIASSLLVFLVLYMLYSTTEILFEVSKLIEKGADVNSSSFLISALVVIFSMGLMSYLFSPLFYFGWVKNPKSENMKDLAGFVTVLYPLMTILGGTISILFFDYHKNILGIVANFLTLFFALVLQLVFLAPLYYYAWRDLRLLKKTSKSS